MKKTRVPWKRLCSSMLVFLMLLTTLPISALAFDEKAKDYIYPTSCKLDEFGNFPLKTGIYPDPEISYPYTKTDDLLEELVFNVTNGSIDLWVTTEDMSDSDTLPYFIDDDNQKWELSKIVINSYSDTWGDIPADNQQQTLLEVTESTTRDDYKIATSAITIPAGNIFHELSSSGFPEMPGYSVWYGWKLSDDQSVVHKYSVSYDLNLPEGATTTYSLLKTNSATPILMEFADTTGTLGTVQSDIAKYNESDVEGEYTIPQMQDGRKFAYLDLLAFDKDADNSGYDIYYHFVGWEHNGTVYHAGDSFEDITKLADSNGAIVFKAKWEKIDPLSSDELKDAQNKLPLYMFGLYDNQQNNILLQWTDGQDKRSEPLTLDENGTIHYQITAPIDPQLTLSSNGVTYYDDFMTLTFHLDLDENLVFTNVSEDGTATLTFDPGPMDYASTNLRDAVENNNTITFNAAEALQLDDIQITFKWFNGQLGDRTLSKPIVISGLEFELKDGVEIDPATFKVETSANITGTVDVKNKAMQDRFYFDTADKLLNHFASIGSEKPWLNYFGTGENYELYTTALVHALQFMDYRLESVNLINDPMIEMLDANTVTATYPGTVTVTPADITIYMGGDHGYDAVVDGTTTGNDDKPSNSMPTPLFYVDVSGVTVEDVEDDITLTGAEGREWKFRLAGKDSSGANLYYIDSTGFEGQDPVRVAFEGKDGKYHLNDTFDPAAVDELFTTYEISIYSGSAGTVLAQVDGKVHNVAVGTGTLTVRAVEETEDNPVVPVTGTVTTPVSAGSAAVTAPSGTTYTLNDTTVPASSTGVGLLFDGIIDEDANRTDALVEAIEADYRINIRDGYFQAQYLDLVDADNGNAWIKASNDVTVYWGYPEGTNQNTKFTLYHFTGLHRDGTNSGFDMEDISKSAIEVVDIEKTANGIAFDVEPGGFSPFVLVWEKPSWPIIIPDIPEDTTPNWLNLDDHDAYIQGYPDGRVKPENNITRAEVATIFYRLLTDDAREYFWSNDSGFSDVKPGDWYNTAVSTMVNAGILTGYNDGSFRPNDPITRAEFATIAARFLSDPYSLQDRFYDTEGHWAEVYINRAAEVGWINGYNDGSFRPDQAITRAEAVTLVNNVLGREPHADYMLDDMITWPDNPKSAWYYEDIQEATNSHHCRWSSDKRYEIWTSLN